MIRSVSPAVLVGVIAADVPLSYLEDAAAEGEDAREVTRTHQMICPD